MDVPCAVSRDLARYQKTLDDYDALETHASRLGMTIDEVLTYIDDCRTERAIENYIERKEYER